MEKYDIVIIGAGISGITLGYLLRKKGKKVLVIEKEKLINKDKLCGGLLTKKSYNLLSEIYNIEDDNDLVIKENKKCIINYSNNKKIEIENIETFSVHRKKLDNYVINKFLDAGGKIIDNTVYSSVDINDNTIVVNNEKYKYDFLVGAEGVFSSLRKEITKKIQETNFAFEIMDKNNSKDLEIYFFDKFCGYGWIIPNFENAMIGMGEVTGKRKIEEEFNNYLEALKIKNCKKRGAFLPNGNDVYLKYKNIFFIGDSAGLISPITGEGVYYALMSAKILSENLNKNYTRKMKSIIRKIKFELLLIKFVYNTKLRNFLFDRYKNNIIIKKVINRFCKIIL